jgi:hypothetical protein
MPIQFIKPAEHTPSLRINITIPWISTHVGPICTVLAILSMKQGMYIDVTSHMLKDSSCGDF